jgi:hypothetical protein
MKTTCGKLGIGTEPTTSDRAVREAAAICIQEGVVATLALTQGIRPAPSIPALTAGRILESTDPMATSGLPSCPGHRNNKRSLSLD